MSVPETALIIGAGPGLSASLARLCARSGMQVALAARNPEKLAALAAETHALTFPCDAADPAAVAALFAQLDAAWPAPPDLVVWNGSARLRAPLLELDPARVRDTLLGTAYAGFLIAQQAARRMLPRGSGTLLFTGATASVSARANSAAFAMGKFALRALAQSLSRELHPQGIHVAHIVIDGAVAPTGQALHPDAIAAEYLHLHRQPRSAWSSELEIRPFAEKF